MKISLLPLLLTLSTPAFAQLDDLDDGLAQTSVQVAPQETSIIDDSRIHFGISLIQSMQNFQLAPGVRDQGGMRGFELGLGIDVFSPSWIVEGTVMDYPLATIDDTSLGMTGFELRLMYERPVLYGVTVHGGLGIANRIYNLKTTARPDFSVPDQDRTFNSGATVLALGIDYWPSGEVSAGVEVTHHMPMAGDDPSSLDFSVRLSGHF